MGQCPLYPGINLGGIKVALFVVIKVPDDRDMMDNNVSHNAHLLITTELSLLTLVVTRNIVDRIIF